MSTETERFIKKCHSFCGAPFSEPYSLNGQNYIGWFQPVLEGVSYSPSIYHSLFVDLVIDCEEFASTFCPTYNRLPFNWQKVMTCLAYRDRIVLDWPRERTIDTYSFLIRDLNHYPSTADAVSFFLVAVATRHLEGTYEDCLSTHSEKALYNLE